MICKRNFVRIQSQSLSISWPQSDGSFKVLSIFSLFLDCFKHDRRLCHECLHVGMCDGQEADACDIISLAEFEIMLNDQLEKLDHQFIELDEEMKIKKEAIVEMYRKDPRVSRDEQVLSLKQRIIDFNPMNARDVPSLESLEIPTSTENIRTIVCKNFSNYDNENVIISSCMRSASSMGVNGGNGYSFLYHPKMENNQIMKWTLRVSKIQGATGMVINLSQLVLV